MPVCVQISIFRAVFCEDMPHQIQILHERILSACRHDDPYHMVDNYEGCLNFIREVGYPVVTKPDNGVGASHTFKISSDEELGNFFANKWDDTVYIMEEFINAEINSYDAIIDSHGNPIFEAGNVTPMSIMDIVNNADNALFYIVKDLADDTRYLGRETAKSFGVRSRFVHFEFFRLLSDHEGLGKKGDLMALEVNMRPSGGFTPDMINFAVSRCHTKSGRTWLHTIPHRNRLVLTTSVLLPVQDGKIFP